MRIWDKHHKIPLYDVLLMITRAEAEELMDTVQQMLADEEQGDYPMVDLNTTRYRQFSLCLYDDENIENNHYCESAMQLIREDI